MISRLKNKGFTIIELLIVIVIIAILATIGVVAYGGVQQNARDSKRKSDISSLHTGFEAYFVQAQTYPSLAQANDNTPTTGFRATSLKGIPDDTYTDPKGTNDQLANAVAANVYAYEVLPAGCDGSAGNECTSYTLTATLESGGTEVRNNTQ
jgi:prepilin-type N-terminal cleavage/methylation domain-containing protein